MPTLCGRPSAGRRTIWVGGSAVQVRGPGGINAAAAHGLNERGAATYCPPVQRLLFVTGKGGVGKTTIAAALARRLAERGRRVLIVDMAADQQLAVRLDRAELTSDPIAIAPRLDAMRVDTQALLESYFRRLLRLPFLSRRLFASGTFRAVTAAAPGVSEFIVLEHLAHWTAPGRFARAAYDTVVVDGPASGHGVRLLHTPAQLAALVPVGPLASVVARLRALVTDPGATAVLPVTIAEEMALTEALELRAALTDAGVRLLRPVLNRVWPRRFTASEAAQIAALRLRRNEPLLAAAGLQLAARREAERHHRTLRRIFGTAPLVVHEACRTGVDPAAVDEIGRALQRGLTADGI
jgi:anion-transporting  ArsA/GET3 family ATPase